ncbi:putative reverse transcriptase domain-containing protein [Tanacetum coccineum]
MPVELGSFDIIIGMDWLANHHVVIVCDEKIMRISYGDEVLIVQGDRGGKGEKSKPIRRIHQGRYGVSVPALTKDHKRNEDQYAVSRGLNTSYSRYGINIIFWKISNVVPTPRNPQYAISNTWIRRIHPTSRPYK